MKQRNKETYSVGKRKRSKRVLWWAAAGVALVAIIAGPLAILSLDPGVAANFADNVLRPVIGNKATVELETALLNLSDSYKRLAYGTIEKPSGAIYNPEPVAKAPTQTPSVLGAETAAAKQAAAVTAADALNLSPLNYFQPGFAKLSGEGQWQVIGLPQFNGQPLMARTFVRPDPARSWAIVALVAMNMHQLRLHSVAGTQYPGAELGHPGPGIIPASVRDSPGLVAAFNGGFQYRDGHYGMLVPPYTYVPLLPNSGTLWIYKDGTLALNTYNGQPVDSNLVAAIRQNGPLIVENGQVTNDAISGGYALWGRTTTNSMYTWRSGIGLTANGNLIYAVGPSLTAATLAQALKAGGAQTAMQLDINAYWVRFVTFQPGPYGYRYESILNTLADGGYQYLHGYNKDFFYVTTAGQ